MTHYKSPEGWTSDVCQLRQVKRGEYFAFGAGENVTVWVRDEYNRATKKYECHLFDDTSHIHEFSGSTVVHINFTF